VSLNENIMNWVKTFKAWIFIGGLMVVVASTAFAWWKVPARVDKMEEVQVAAAGEREETQDNVQKMADRVDQYIEMQEVKEVANEKVDVERDKRYQEQQTHQMQQNDMMWKVLNRVTEDK